MTDWDYRVNVCERCLADNRRTIEDVRPCEHQGRCFTCGFGFDPKEMRRVFWGEVRGYRAPGEHHSVGEQADGGSLFAHCQRCGTIHLGVRGSVLLCGCESPAPRCEVVGVSRVRRQA